MLNKMKLKANGCDLRDHGGNRATWWMRWKEKAPFIPSIAGSSGMKQNQNKSALFTNILVKFPCIPHIKRSPGIHWREDRKEPFAFSTERLRTADFPVENADSHKRSKCFCWKAGYPDGLAPVYEWVSSRVQQSVQFHSVPCPKVTQER